MALFRFDWKAVLLLSALLLIPRAHAQWLTQTFELKAGWNAVYLHVDLSHATLTELIDSDDSNPIREVWLWEPSRSTQQFVDGPQSPTPASTQWVNWQRNLGPSSGLQRLRANVACLIRVDWEVPTYLWQVKGRPALPRNDWTVTGLNFIGFPTHATTPPFWEDFLSRAPELQQNIEVYRYPGGELGPGNPARLFAFRTTPLRRGQAFWIRSGSYNRYFGPVEVVPQSADGLKFGASGSLYRIRIRNTVAEPVTVTLNLLPSEQAPVGQPSVAGVVPLLVRGDLNLENLTHGYTALHSQSRSWALAPRGQPNSEAEIIIGLNRHQMNSAPGDLYAGILRFTDSLGFTQIDLPVSAEVASTAGLWVGNAVVDSVHHHLIKFAQVTNRVAMTNLLVSRGDGQGINGYTYQWEEASGRIMVFGGPENKTGSYYQLGVKTDAGKVPRPFPLRLIIHNDGANSRLLQRVYHGIGPGSIPMISTAETGLTSARRISAVHLPFSKGNVPWPFTGPMAQGTNMSCVVDLEYTAQESNPFLHSYHPDHDNLDPLYEGAQELGVESYRVQREIRLSFLEPSDDFAGLTTGSQSLSGNYQENIHFSSTATPKTFHSSGTFVIRKNSPIAHLTTP
jgi:hypothetical protein